MPAQPLRHGASEPGEPVVHELIPIRYAGAEVPVRLAVRRCGDGMWRARLLYGQPEATPPVTTAEIFCAATETDLWQAVRDLRDHHLRDLYRSLLG